MLAVTKNKLLIALVIFICLIAVPAACTPTTLDIESSDDPIPEQGDVVEDIQEPVEVPEADESSEDSEAEPEPTPADDDQGEPPTGDEGSESMDGEVPIEPEFGSEVLPCPPKGSTLVLGFDHALTVNYMETSLSHFLHQGWLNLTITDDNGTIASISSGPLVYTMEGVMSQECSLTSEGTMTPSAHGTCEAGVVNLIIEENWSALNGQMTCIDPDDGDVEIMPFNTPSMGKRTHSGENGLGEIFYLVEGAQGYTTMRPFIEGDGYHSWTLYAPDIELEPLVPEE